MAGQIRHYEPAIADAAAKAVAAAKRDLQFLLLDEAALASAPRKSIDYAVMEHSKEVAVVPADIGWSDVGTWSSVLDLSEKDAHGNSVRGQGVVVGGNNVLIRSEDHLTAVVGVSNVIVVTTTDAVLVLDARQADRVKELVETLKKQQRREVIEHKRIYRPWGYYQGIDQGGRYQVKRIVVKPQGRLSLQKHFHRAEHWVVVKGTAEVTLDTNVTLVHENESIYLPIGCVHRMSNPGKIDLELIEVQVGSYLGEDDIVRIEDVYNRG
jgi:mannose-1-phosphate guanylyltransferase/mannose-6-phosphate isomerase